MSVDKIEILRVITSRMRNARYGLGGSRAGSLLRTTAPTELRTAVRIGGDKSLEVLKRLREEGAVNYSTGVYTRELGVGYPLLEKLETYGIISRNKDNKGHTRWFLTRRGLRIAEGV